MQTSTLEYLERGALRHSPGKTAIIDGDRHWSFAALAERAQGIAALIIGRGIGTHHAVAVYLPKSAGVIAADLGVLYSGNVYMNLDVKAPAQRTRNIVAHIGTVAIITTRALSRQLIDAGVSADHLLLIELDTEGQGEPVARDEGALARVRRQVLDVDPMCIINTSGSTGTPKGVAISHRSTIDFVDWAIGTFGFDGTERLGFLSPVFFDHFTFELNLCLATGATLVIISDPLPSFPARLVDFIRDHEVNFIFWVPSIMTTIANQGLLDSMALPALTRVWFAGEVFPMKQLNRWRRAFPGADFVNLYGPTEASVDCTYFVVDREFGDDDPLPIGTPCRNTDVLVLTSDNTRAGAGDQGELCIRGTSLALGYWNDPDRTAQAFVQNPLQRHYPETIYRTGDLASVNDRGELMFLGRRDFQVKHMGYRIELLEIEHQILSIPGIANACVVYNAPRREITLFYQPVGELTPAAIRQELSDILPKYMLPTAFHRLAELPRNPNGKIDRQALAAAIGETPS